MCRQSNIIRSLDPNLSTSRISHPPLIHMIVSVVPSSPQKMSGGDVDIGASSDLIATWNVRDPEAPTNHIPLTGFESQQAVPFAKDHARVRETQGYRCSNVEFFVRVSLSKHVKEGLKGIRLYIIHSLAGSFLICADGGLL